MMVEVMENNIAVDKQIRETIFISHATPDDNTFAAWLATKLELCGYKVWIDLNNLSPSVDFWNTIDNTIRNEAVKFVFVISKHSVDSNRDGVKKELAVADRVKKQFSDFIVPVRIDDVSFNDLPIEVLRLNAIDFNNDWAKGLNELLKYLNDKEVPKPAINNASSFYIYRWLKSQSKSQLSSQIMNNEEEYSSNLFSVELPPLVYIYRTEDAEKSLRERHIPLKINKSVVVTFACNDCLSDWNRKPIDYLSFDTLDAINSQTLPGVFLGEKIVNLSNDILLLVNWSIGDMFFKRGLRKLKQESNKVSRNVYYFPYNTKSKRSPGSRQKLLSGTYKTVKRWHFGLSGYYTQYPRQGCIMKWHIVFTDTKGCPLPDNSQVAARRSKGKLMFNKQWKELIEASMYYLSGGTANIFYTACCERNAMYIRSHSMRFVSDISYTEPCSCANVLIDGDE